MGPLGVPETVFIAVLALLIFGPKKLPELGKTLGKAMGEFRRASSDLRATFDREMHAIERENESLKEVTQKYVKENFTPDTYRFDNYYDSGAYETEPENKPANDPSTVSASAPQGAENTVQPAAAETHVVSTAPGEVLNRNQTSAKEKTVTS